MAVSNLNKNDLHKLNELVQLELKCLTSDEVMDACAEMNISGNDEEIVSLYELQRKLIGEIGE